MQQIIVYSSPAEAAIWNALSGAEAFPVMLAIVAFFIVFLSTNHMMENMARKSRLRRGKALAFMGYNNSTIALVVGAVAGIFVGWFFWI